MPDPFATEQLKKDALSGLFDNATAPMETLGFMRPEPFVETKPEPYQKKDVKIKELTERVDALERERWEPVHSEQKA